MTMSELNGSISMAGKNNNLTLDPDLGVNTNKPLIGTGLFKF
jgi:hypothetical protein